MKLGGADKGGGEEEEDDFFTVPNWDNDLIIQIEHPSLKPSST